MIAGPSEILVVSDGKSDPAWLAADLLSQAEHDKLATAILITDSMPLAEAVQAEVERQLSVLPREEIARAAVEANGKIIVVSTLDEAVEMANAVAPEAPGARGGLPLRLPAQGAQRRQRLSGPLLPRAARRLPLRHQPHPCPRWVRRASPAPLGVEDFVKRSYFSYYTAEALEAVADAAALFADAEGLHATPSAPPPAGQGGEAE